MTLWCCLDDEERWAFLLRKSRKGCGKRCDVVEDKDTKNERGGREKKILVDQGFDLASFLVGSLRSGVL